MGLALVVAMILEDGAPVSYAGEVPSSLWSGSVLDSDMSVVGGVAVMVGVRFGVLECTLIDFASDVGTETDVNANMWAAAMPVSELTSSIL